jgi:hypothetical protein
VNAEALDITVNMSGSSKTVKNKTIFAKRKINALKKLTAGKIKQLQPKR